MLLMNVDMMLMCVELYALVHILDSKFFFSLEKPKWNFYFKLPTQDVWGKIDTTKRLTIKKMMYDKACNSRVQSQKICIVRIKFLSLRFKWFKCKVWDYILLDKTYLNECIESYFCFNFQENLFIIVGDNFHYK